MGVFGKEDHQIKIGSTTKDLIIMQDDEKRVLYKIEEDIPEHQDPLLVTQTNWIDGQGRHDVTQGDEDMYFEGASIDTTQDGRLILGPLINEVKEDDDTDLDSAPVCFLWFARTSELLCGTSGKIYRYVKDDTGIDTDEALDTTEVAITCDADASSAILANSIIIADSELMFVTSVATTTLTVVRGFRGTTAAEHDTNKDLYIYKWTAATTAVAGVTDMVEFNRVAYAAIGSSAKYYYSTDGDTWTQSALTDAYADKFLSAPNEAGTANVMWKTRAATANPNEVTNIADPAGATQWGSPAYVGDTSNVITNIFLDNDDFMVGKTDNLYYYAPNGGVHPLMEELKHNRDTQNFKYVTRWQAGTYFSLTDSLGEIIGQSKFSRMGPLTGIDDIGKVGTCVGLASDDDWLYVAMDEGTNTIIYKGREVRKKGALRWQWCPFINLGTKTCATLKVVQHSSKDKRLWFGYTDNTAFVILSEDPTADTDARFASAGWVRMSYNYGTNQYWDKMFQSVVTETEGCSADVNVTPKYRSDAATSATTLTAAITTNGTVKTNLSSALSCKRIQFELHFTTNVSASTSEVKLFQARGIEKPETIRIHEVTYNVDSDRTRQADTLKTFLEGGRTSTSLIRFADLRFSDTVADSGGYCWVIMEPGYPKFYEHLHEKGRVPMLAATLRLKEVSFTLS